MNNILVTKVREVFPNCKTDALAEMKLLELNEKKNMGVSELARLFCVNKGTVSRKLKEIRLKKEAGKY